MLQNFGPRILGHNAHNLALADTASNVGGKHYDVLCIIIDDIS